MSRTNLPSDLTELLDPTTRTPLNRPIEAMISSHELTNNRIPHFVKNRRKVNILDLVRPPVRTDAERSSSSSSSPSEHIDVDDDTGFFSVESHWNALLKFVGYSTSYDDERSENEDEGFDFAKVDAVV